MAALLEAFAQLFVVVNLTVEYQPDTVRASMHRLMPGWRKIDDRQTSKSKAAPRVVENQFASVIRTAMRHRVAHRHEQVAPNIAARRTVFPESANAAHVLVFRSCQKPDR